jgi:hypothetical protein
MKMKNFKKSIIKISIFLTLALISNITAFANNPSPANVDTSTMNTLIGIVFWIVRIGILAVGAVPALIKLAQSAEDPRDRNSAIGALIITGACFGGSFAIQSLM